MLLSQAYFLKFLFVIAKSFTDPLNWGTEDSLNMHARQKLFTKINLNKVGWFKCILTRFPECLEK